MFIFHCEGKNGYHHLSLPTKNGVVHTGGIFSIIPCSVEGAQFSCFRVTNICTATTVIDKEQLMNDHGAVKKPGAQEQRC